MFLCVHVFAYMSMLVEDICKHGVLSSVTLSHIFETIIYRQPDQMACCQSCHCFSTAPGLWDCIGTTGFLCGSRGSELSASCLIGNNKHFN